jgi:sugar (pentulose or hexulose) kinase
MKLPVIIIFDVGKTNKKVLLFDEQYKLLKEENTQLEEMTDEDGFPCEGVDRLTNWVRQKFSEMLIRKDVDVKAVNFSAYGASFVHLDEGLNIVAPLYNYLKPYPENLKKQFYDTYGGEGLIARETASPVLGSLNSGMQLYRLKYEKPEVYKNIKYSLHLPQYLNFIISKTPSADLSSVGCHTNLWDFAKNGYHDWVYKEGLDKKFAPLYSGDKIVGSTDDKIQIGIGLHDSSAALIPYLASFREPFVLISTGTWCISLNPFNHTELTGEELKQDCLCYLSYEGKPVKASRLFAGYEHEQQVKRLTAYFQKATDHYQTVEYNAALLNELQTRNKFSGRSFSELDLFEFTSYEEAYHHLMWNIVQQQTLSTNLVIARMAVKRIFVDGGFGKNQIYMSLLAKAFPEIEVYAAAVPQASALGAALVIHHHWNKNSLAADIIKLTRFTDTELNYSN